MASVASATIRKSAASTGARNAIPPQSRMSSEPSARSASSATTKNSGATTRPWLTDCSSAPWAPWPRVEGEDPERDEPELRDRRVAEDQPRVRLREGLDRAVEDRDHRQDQQDRRCQSSARVREQRQDDPQEAVGRDLREHAGEERERRQRHRLVRVRHPAVERERRHLDQERERERDEEPLLRGLRQRVRLQVGEHEESWPPGFGSTAVATAAASISSEPTSV